MKNTLAVHIAVLRGSFTAVAANSIVGMASLISLHVTGAVLLVS